MTKGRERDGVRVFGDVASVGRALAVADAADNGHGLSAFKTR